jgi:hypothetical protein
MSRLHDAAAALDDYRRERDAAEPDLFSALASVAEHEGHRWRDQALDLLHVIASTKATFTVEDLDDHLPPTLDRRAVGWVLRQGAKNGWMRADGYVNGGRSRHGRPVVRWVSLIGGDPT